MTVTELKFEIPKRMKYRNVKVEVDNIKFDSKKEAAYYSKLKLLQKAGDVISFTLQPKYMLTINGVKCGFYKADFKVEWKSGIVRVVDVKSSMTKTLPVYNLKKKLVFALYGIQILEV